MKKWLRKRIVVPIASLAVLVLGTGLYQQPRFGKLPDGSRLERIKSSPHYDSGQFQNLVLTPKFVEGDSSAAVTLKYLLGKKERLKPAEPIPVAKTDLKALDKTQDIVVWLGHSSYFLQLGGKRILIDPVFNTYASPVFFVNRAFAGTNQYSADDMPEIDYLLISHDHWDHLDYDTVTALRSKVNQVVCGLGVGAYLEQWGYEQSLIHEADWFGTLELDKDFVIHVLPARHFSGRMLTPNKTLWVGYALITPDRRVFYSGDGGYGPHFKQIGERLKGFDLAIMENGQYDARWPNIHMMPEEVAQATEDLHAKALLPGHAGKFAIANHAWDEPYDRVTAASRNKPYALFTPKIGEPVAVADPRQQFTQWWKGIE